MIKKIFLTLITMLTFILSPILQAAEESGEDDLQYRQAVEFLLAQAQESLETREHSPREKAAIFHSQRLAISKISFRDKITRINPVLLMKDCQRIGAVVQNCDDNGFIVDTLYLKVVTSRMHTLGLENDVGKMEKAVESTLAFVSEVAPTLVSYLHLYKDLKARRESTIAAPILTTQRRNSDSQFSEEYRDKDFDDTLAGIKGLLEIGANSLAEE